MLSIPNQLEGAYVGQDVALECHTEAYPTSINYWTTEKGDMIVSGKWKSNISLFFFSIEKLVSKCKNVVIGFTSKTQYEK